MRIERDGTTNTITIHPEIGHHSATLVILHGLGDSGEGFADVGESLHRIMPHVKFILPTADSNPVTLNGGMRMPSWYDIVGLDDRSAEQVAGIEKSVNRVVDFLDAEHTMGLPYSRMAVAGFSQGGALSLFTGLQLPVEKRIAGIVALSAYLPGASKFNLTPGLEDVPVLHCHGKSDVVVQYAWGIKTKDLLTSKGMSSYRLQSYDSVGHNVTPAIVQEVTRFLSQILPADDAYIIKAKPPKDMSIKELKEAIRIHGLSSQSRGFMEKSEYVRLLQSHYEATGIVTSSTSSDA